MYSLNGAKTCVSGRKVCVHHREEIFRWSGGTTLPKMGSVLKMGVHMDENILKVSHSGREMIVEIICHLCS